MRRFILFFLVLLGCLGLASSAFAELLPGKTVEERCINGAKAYIKKHNLKNPELNVLQISLFRHSHPKYDREWEELTGIKIKPVVYGYTDIPAKIMAEAVAKTGQWDVFMQFPRVVPDASGAGVLKPLDGYAARVQPDFSGVAPALLQEQYYNGKLYTLLLDGDHIILVLRKDIMELANEDYKKKFGKDCQCPTTMEEWEEMAAYFHTKPGETRWGKTFEKGLYGAMGYRSMNFAHRHFPAYFGSLYFDKDMNPRINTPNGIRAIKEFSSIVKYMPEDILGWATAQIYPFWRSGQAFSVMSFPSIVGSANKEPTSKIKGQQISCVIPGVKPRYNLVRRSPDAAGTCYMVSNYSKHPELAYYYIQWLSGPTKGDELIADGKGFWDAFRTSNLTNAAVIDKFGDQFLKATIENAGYAQTLLRIQGNYEYWNVLDKNLTLVMQGNISAEEAAKRIEKGWNEVTEDIGRDEQIKAWRKSVNAGAYITKFTDIEGY
jgi:multiple sugar transport system substrate-binding protein